MYEAPIVVVEWWDAFVDTDDFDMKKAAKTKAVRRRTIGFFVCETDEGVVMATDEYEKDGDGFSARLFVPHGMIVRWYSLEVIE